MDPVLLQSNEAQAVGFLLTVGFLATVWSSIEIVPAGEKRVLTVFGSYRRLLEPGVSLVAPFVSETYPIDMRSQTVAVPPQPVITKDDLQITANIFVDISKHDAEAMFSEVADHEQAVINTSISMLRAVVGEYEASVVANNRSTIGYRIRRELNPITEEWGMRVEQVDLRSVDLPNEHNKP